MSKLPYMQFFPADWISDTRALTNEAKGVWIDLLAFMWNSRNRGEISKKLDDIGRMVSMTHDEIHDVICQLKDADVADIEVDENEFVRIVSRRMQREEKQRVNDKKRKAKSRLSGDCPENVRALSREIPPESLESRVQNLESKGQNPRLTSGEETSGFVVLNSSSEKEPKVSNQKGYLGFLDLGQEKFVRMKFNTAKISTVGIEQILNTSLESIIWGVAACYQVADDLRNKKTIKDIPAFIYSSAMGNGVNVRQIFYEKAKTDIRDASLE